MYGAVFSETFEGKARDVYPHLAARINDRVRLLRQAPYTAAHSHLLKWRYRGKRAARLTENARIIFVISEECARQGHQGLDLEDCPYCRGVPPNTVNFLDVVDYH